MLNPTTKVYIYVAAIELDLQVTGWKKNSSGSYSVDFKRGYEDGYITLTLQQIMEWTKSRDSFNYYRQNIEPLNPKADFSCLSDLIHMGPIPYTFMQSLVLHNQVLNLPNLEASHDREDGLSLQTDGMGIAALSPERLEELLEEYQQEWLDECNQDIKSYNWDPY